MGLFNKLCQVKTSSFGIFNISSKISSLKISFKKNQNDSACPSKICKALSPETEQWLLNYFINRFLPKSNNKRKYFHNEFSFIHTTISGIFFRFRRVKITEDDLLICLARSGYKIYVRDKPVRNMQQDNRGRTALTPVRGCMIYIGTSSARIIDLKKAIRSIAYQKNQSKINFLVSLKEEIHNFFKWNQRVSL